MTTAALISLRETFEASLIVCVMLAFLERSKRQNFAPALWMGVGTGIVFSILLAWLMQMYATTLGAEVKELYEGIMMLIAAGLLLWMIGWMAMSGRSMKMHIEKNMAAHIAGGSALGIFLLSFTSTAREGTEMVLLINATLFTSTNIHTLAGVGIGVTAALAVAALLFRGSRRIPVRLFFAVTGVVLLVLGVWLTIQGIGELQEAGVFTGYEVTPSVLQVLGGTAYASVAACIWQLTRRPRTSSAA